MTTAPPQEKSHKEPARQAPRRIVPVIPRQLARPRKQQTSGQVKEKDEVEQKVEIPAARPEVEPVTAPSHEEVRQSRKQPLDGPSVAEEDKSAVNGQTPTKEGVPAVVNGNQKTEQTPSEVKTEQSQEQAKGVKQKLKQSKKPAQLPPPFVPSRTLHDSMSSSKTTLPPPPFPVAQPHSFAFGHDAIVFGGPPDSSSASPIPPVSTDAIFMPPPAPLLLPATGPVPHFPDDIDTHTHHLHYPPPATFHPQQPYQDWAPPTSSFQQSASHPLISHVNGLNRMSRTPSQASSAAIEGPLSHPSNSGIITPDTLHHPHAINGLNHPRAASQHSFPQHSAAPSSSAHQPPPSSDMHNMRSMRRHLLATFGSYEFADYVLDLSAGKQFPAHAVVLARSPGLLAMMRASSKHERVLYINSEHYFKESDAFVNALRYLYLGDLLDARRLLAPPQSVNSDSAVELSARMNYVLSYVASGLTLDIRDIHGIGVQVAQDLLCWQTLEPALDFVLNSRFNYRDNAAGQHILRLFIEYTVTNFPLDFALDSSAPQLLSVPRLPQASPATPTQAILPKHRRQSTNHQLEKIRFGDAPATQETSFANAILSSVLMSLSFDVLEDIFMVPRLAERISSIMIAQHLYNIVGEREARRRAAFKIHCEQGKAAEELKSGVAQNLFWEEAVEPSPQHIGGIRLVRRRI